MIGGRRGPAKGQAQKKGFPTFVGISLRPMEGDYRARSRNIADSLPSDTGDPFMGHHALEERVNDGRADTIRGSGRERAGSTAINRCAFSIHRAQVGNRGMDAPQAGRKTVQFLPSSKLTVRRASK